MALIGVLGWVLGGKDRDRLLASVAPRYLRVVAHHVTLRAQSGPNDQPPSVGAAQVVGEADDGVGVQALVVAVDGATDRPGGGVYHITWSLGPGRTAVESNDVIAAQGWKPLEPMPIRLTPARL